LNRGDGAGQVRRKTGESTDRKTRGGLILNTLEDVRVVRKKSQHVNLRGGDEKIKESYIENVVGRSILDFPGGSAKLNEVRGGL